MEGTLLAGDVVLTDHARVDPRVLGTDRRQSGYEVPRRGEVWVFTSGRARGEKQVKRLMGMPGDTLAMRNGVVWVNGEELDEPYVGLTTGRARPHTEFAWQRAHLAAAANPAAYAPTRDDWGPLLIPAGFYFALGDNRDQSWDSRHTGLVGHDRLEGRVAFVLFSYGRLPTTAVLPRPRGIRWSRIGRRVHRRDGSRSAAI